MGTGTAWERCGNGKEAEAHATSASFPFPCCGANECAPVDAPVIIPTDKRRRGRVGGLNAFFHNSDSCLWTVAGTQTQILWRHLIWIRRSAGCSRRQTAPPRSRPRFPPFFHLRNPVQFDSKLTHFGPRMKPPPFGSILVRIPIKLNDFEGILSARTGLSATHV